MTSVDVAEGRFAPATLERFWSKVNVGGPGDCWEWNMALASTGYGRFHIGRAVEGKYQYTSSHRYAYETANGPIPAGYFIDHMCRNRACVNPAHLRAVTPKVNALENSACFAAANARKTHCSQGHPFSAENLKPNKHGYRRCRICELEWTRRYKARLKARRALAGEAA